MTELIIRLKDESKLSALLGALRSFTASEGVEIAIESGGRKLTLNQFVEDYTPERIAEFLLSNAVDADDYAAALEQVAAMGVDPATIPHYKPAI